MRILWQVGNLSRIWLFNVIFTINSNHHIAMGKKLRPRGPQMFDDFTV